jgi:hypothetical protein
MANNGKLGAGRGEGALGPFYLHRICRNTTPEIIIILLG